MAYSLVQPSLAGGEISPSLYGRIDLEKYQTSLRRCRNFIVRQSGGIENRPGFRFLGSAKYADRYCRLIPFQFSVSQPMRSSSAITISVSGLTARWLRTAAALLKWLPHGR
ncbi:Uncharacterised protein [Klebsiella pneumoniae]|uniref:Uncharacterized protein n=1 Tax=Klebsiella pneumoniae TaxID=573 RepID=A0A378AGE2_KLEPN|nr:Uncharacterised protein [Klebsiella pneumoniae]